LIEKSISSITAYMRPGFLIALVFLLAMLGGCIYWSYKPAWQFDHLEQNARKVITAQELQAWATRLLDEYPTMQSNYLWASQLHTNFPPQLRGLAPRLGQSVSVLVFDDTNEPPFVNLTWGSGFLGATGFYVGRTNFTTPPGLNRTCRAWQPGVYFFRR
jgi:hypothetical protein